MRTNSTVKTLLKMLVFLRLIKLTSPKLNLLIVLGAAMLYSCVFLYIYSVTDSGANELQTLLCYVCMPLLYSLMLSIRNAMHHLNLVLVHNSAAATMVVFTGLHTMLCCHSG